MTRAELIAKLKELEGYASINQRYHQAMADRWGRRDRALKITLGFLTVFGFAISVAPPSSMNAAESWTPWVLWFGGLVLGFLSLLAAVALNVAPMVSIERAHAAAFARWTYLFQDITTLRANVDLVKDSELRWLAKRVPELTAKISEIEREESAPDEVLMLKCQEDENEYRWGAGIRTHEQVIAERDRRAQAVSETPISQPG